MAALAAGAYFYISNSTSFFKSLNKQKSSSEYDILSKSFTSAIFNYTAYAIKERWCMDENWGRDKNCGSTNLSDMNSVVTYSRNLERFLWSKGTLNDMSLRYQQIYGYPPKQEFALKSLQQNISMAKLELLGNSHPINLVIDDKIKKCLSSVDIKIEKPLTSYYKPQGDEVYLLISIKGNLVTDIFKSCTLIKQAPLLKGLVIFYPKTLNQYAMIKADDFNVSSFPDSTKGLDFYGPVYIQKNLVLPTSGMHSVSFKDKVRIGEGILKKATLPYVPETPGGSSNQLLSQLTTIKGLLNGVSLEAEVDEGLPRLFGGSYTYPSNVNMGDCTNRKALKDNFSLTKNSRLWARGSGGHYIFGLSESDEFREYIRHGSTADGDYLYNVFLSAYNTASADIKNQLDVKIESSPKSKPVMEAYVALNGVEYSKVYIGRDSQVKIIFAKESFFTEQKNLLDIDALAYLDISKIKLADMGLDNTLADNYQFFRNECVDAKADGFNFKECKKVDDTVDATTSVDCNSLTDHSKKNDCNKYLNKIDTKRTSYFATQTSIINDLTGFLNNLPNVVINTTTVLSNKEDIKFSFSNTDSFKYPFVSNISSIKFRFNAYDFAIEDSNNTVYGERRAKPKLMPGPNDSGFGKENVIDYKVKRYGDMTFKSIDPYRTDGTLLDSAVATKWWILKNDNKAYDFSEPPGNFPTNPDMHPPVDGLTVADAKALDDACDIDTNALPPPSWDVSFTENTKFSWLYNVTNPGITIVNPSQVQPMPTYTFTTLDMDVGNYQGVPTRSIVLECIVPSSIDFVFGFYVCQKLTISPRSRPLNMVGTYIVKDLNIDSSALNAGVNFYSIWSSGGVELLRAKKHLRREKSTTEDCIFNVPGWYSALDEDTLADFQSCSPSKFLYQGANNFNWTTVDPEIGITGTGTQVTTQAKVVNRYRRYGANIVWQRYGLE